MVTKDAGTANASSNCRSGTKLDERLGNASNMVPSTSCCERKLFGAERQIDSSPGILILGKYRNKYPSWRSFLPLLKITQQQRKAGMQSRRRVKTFHKLETRTYPTRRQDTDLSRIGQEARFSYQKHMKPDVTACLKHWVKVPYRKYLVFYQTMNCSKCHMTKAAPGV